MSQGAAGVAPIGIVLAAGAVVVVAAAGAAVLVAYATNQAAEGALRAVGRVGAALEAEGAAQCEADRQALTWQAAAADVVGLNARLRMAAAQAHRLGAPIDVPPPLDLTGRTCDQVRAWASRTERQLTAAMQALDEAAGSAFRSRLMAGLPDSTPDRESTARALVAYQASLRASRVVDDPRAPDVTDDVAALLARIDPDATPAEHETALRAALLARTRQDAHDADAYVLALERLVDGEIKKAAAGRRRAAQWVHALELPVVAAALSEGDPRPPFSGTAARLLAVVNGTTRLTDELDAEGRLAAEWAGEVTRRQFLRDRVLRLLVADGYDVDVESESARGTRINASREGWDGEHSALLFIGSDGTVAGRLARHRPRSGADGLVDDQARCGDLHALLHQLESPTSGVTVIVDADQPPALTYHPDTVDDTETATRRPAPGYRTRG